MNIKKLNEFIWEIDKENGMNFPIKIYANQEIMNTMQKDRTLMQAANVAKLPSIVKNMIIMPDGHEGYGFPVGGVAAFDAENGIISPGAVGFDINCGVRLIKTNLSIEDVKPRINSLMDSLFKNIPSGVGSKINMGFTKSDLEKIALEGVEYIIKKGYGIDQDLERIEENGCIKNADPDKVSNLANERGKQQLGTLGAGNHFLEVQKVGKIFDKSIADRLGLYENQVVVMLHSGSRGYGHQVCSDYLKTLSDYQRQNNIALPDPELAYAFIGSKEADNYQGAMFSAVNFAFANRQIMTNSIRKSFEQVFGKSSDALGMELLY
ncbi:MAG: RtcB family protein, partial [Candidatus Micrarchaeaceae archaeon]